MHHRSKRGTALAVFLALGIALLQGLTPTSASAQVRILPPTDAGSPIDEVLRRGVEMEGQRRWGDALGHYEEALRESPDDARLQERHGIAKLHYDLSRRYRDASFRRDLLALRSEVALDAYSDVLLKIDAHYVHDVQWRLLFDNGTQALDIALAEPCFIETHLARMPAERVAAFRRQLLATTRGLSINNRYDASGALAVVAGLARRELGLSTSAVVMEYLAGAVDSLDNYSAFLTGDQLRDVYAQIDGNFVGLGVELKADAGSLLIVSVISGSPAQQAGIRAGDYILSVGPKSTRGLTTDEAAVLLQGAENSIVDLVVVTGSEQSRTLRIRRQHVEVPSVDDVRIVDAAAGVGYLKINSFQRNTSRDLDSALWNLHRQGMRSLIVDLRGNPGGLLNASVEAADRFISQGTIVSTRGRSKQEDYDYSARPGATWRVPLVVLIDAQSASASEIFAAAIRDHRRGTIVGKRSYGKGSVQGIFPLATAGTGLRLTTAKFYGPTGRPINHVGVSPDVVVQTAARATTEGRLPEAGQDDALSAGINAARGSLAQR